jgi:hypothetical protein
MVEIRVSWHLTSQVLIPFLLSFPLGGSSTSPNSSSAPIACGKTVKEWKWNINSQEESDPGSQNSTAMPLVKRRRCSGDYQVEAGALIIPHDAPFPAVQSNLVHLQEHCLVYKLNTKFQRKEQGTAVHGFLTSTCEHPQLWRGNRRHTSWSLSSLQLGRFPGLCFTIFSNLASNSSALFFLSSLRSAFLFLHNRGSHRCIVVDIAGILIRSAMNKKYFTIIVQ